MWKMTHRKVLRKMEAKDRGESSFPTRGFPFPRWGGGCRGAKVDGGYLVGVYRSW